MLLYVPVVFVTVSRVDGGTLQSIAAVESHIIAVHGASTKGRVNYVSPVTAEAIQLAVTVAGMLSA